MRCATPGQWHIFLPRKQQSSALQDHAGRSGALERVRTGVCPFSTAPPSAPPSPSLPLLSSPLPSLNSSPLSLSPLSFPLPVLSVRNRYNPTSTHPGPKTNATKCVHGVYLLLTTYMDGIETYALLVRTHSAYILSGPGTARRGSAHSRAQSTRRLRSLCSFAAHIAVI